MTVLSVNSPRLAAPLLPRPHRVIRSFKKAYSAYKILIAGSELPYTRFPIIVRESQPASRGSGRKPMSSGPKGCEEPSSLQCCVCGHRAELFDLPGRTGKYCLECSADVATSILLTTEIDAATLAGQDASALVAEFSQLSTSLLERAQSA
jgi:hypothetical protein